MKSVPRLALLILSSLGYIAYNFTAAAGFCATKMDVLPVLCGFVGTLETETCVYKNGEFLNIFACYAKRGFYRPRKKFNLGTANIRGSVCSKLAFNFS